MDLIHTPLSFAGGFLMSSIDSSSFGGFSMSPRNSSTIGGFLMSPRNFSALAKKGTNLKINGGGELFSGSELLNPFPLSCKNVIKKRVMATDICPRASSMYGSGYFADDFVQPIFIHDGDSNEQVGGVPEHMWKDKVLPHYMWKNKENIISDVAESIQHGVSKFHLFTKCSEASAEHYHDQLVLRDTAFREWEELSYYVWRGHALSQFGELALLPRVVGVDIITYLVPLLR